MYPRLLVAVLGVGVFAFGAVYPWAYFPFIAALVLIGCLWGRRGAIDPLLRRWTIALALIAAAIVVQIIPLPRSLLATISPGTHQFLELYAIDYAVGVARFHPLSLQPHATMIALFCFIGLSLFTLGILCALTTDDARRVCDGVVAVTAVMAVVAIAVRDSQEGRVYGIWMPRSPATPFGPFVNPNHFGGWMLVAIPICAARLGERADALLRRAAFRRGLLRNLTSEEGSKAILNALALMIMAIAFIACASRSAFVALFVSATVAIAAGARRGLTRDSRLMFAAACSVLVIVAALAVGLNGVIREFDRLGASDIASRVSIWKDTVRIIQDFPVTGVGINAFATATVLYQTTGRGIYHVVQSHNDFLQIAAEGGLLVGVPVMFATALFIRAARHRLRSHTAADEGMLRSGALAGVLAVTVQETVEFSLQIPANAALFAIAIAVALHANTARASNLSIR